MWTIRVTALFGLLMCVNETASCVKIIKITDETTCFLTSHHKEQYKLNTYLQTHLHQQYHKEIITKEKHNAQKQNHLNFYIGRRDAIISPTDTFAFALMFIISSACSIINSYSSYNIICAKKK